MRVFSERRPLLVAILFLFLLLFLRFPRATPVVSLPTYASAAYASAAVAVPSSASGASSTGSTAVADPPPMRVEVASPEPVPPVRPPTAPAPPPPPPAAVGVCRRGAQAGPLEGRLEPGAPALVE